MSFPRVSSCLRASALLPLVSLLLAIPAAAHDLLGLDPSSPDPLLSASSGGLPAVDDALARLGEHRRLLVIAAHPDDEDTFLLTLVSRGQHGEAAYLSLSRGDGGQNLIGDELGEGLGLLRSRELEAARRIDGARQFFSRAYDFGYTRSFDETLGRWPREVLVEDAMRVVRRFRPQVLVAVFPPTAAAGHGQHQASGWVAEEIFELSRSEDDAFPELTAEGLEPWRLSSLYRAAWFRPETATLRLPLGQLDPHAGRSIFQTALLSRSQHRCQDMGFEQPPGDAEGAVTWLAGAGEGSPEADLFSGVDTRLAALASPLADAEQRRRVAAELEDVAALARRARSKLGPTALDAAAPPLGEIVRRLEGLLAGLGEPSVGDGRRHVRALLEEKLGLARRGLAAAAGLVADAVTDAEVVTPGESFAVRTLLWNAGETAISDLEIELESAAGWTSGQAEPVEPKGGFFSARVDDEREARVTVPEDAPPSVPYFLRRPRRGDLYDWTGVDAEVKAKPFGPPPLVARFSFRLDAGAGPVDVVLRREVVHRRRDQALGEVRRPLRAVPKLEVRTGRELILRPLDRREPVEVRVEVASNLPVAATAAVRVEAPEGWSQPEGVAVTLDAGGRAEVVVELEPPADLAAGSFDVAAEARLEGDARAYTGALDLVDYPHIRPAVLPTEATTRLVAIDLGLPELERVAYVRGASDRVPELLAAVGVPIEVVGAEELLSLPLAGYDAVVLGSRAYEVEPALAAANARLLAYARDGGLVIVQYQQYAYSQGALAPYALEIRRPHDRITDEAAPVRHAMAGHPVLTHPNVLGEADWLGWVQERGLYFAGTFGEQWQAPLAMADPGGEEQRGGLLVAPVGEGRYVYTGLAFFRQLPAGVPGAYRLFANLLALAEDAP